MPTERDEERAAEVLHEHSYAREKHQGSGFYCECGAYVGDDAMIPLLGEHQAQMLADAGLLARYPGLNVEVTRELNKPTYVRVERGDQVEVDGYIWPTPIEQARPLPSRDEIADAIAEGQDRRYGDAFDRMSADLVLALLRGENDG
jgi:hypothetical protein